MTQTEKTIQDLLRIRELQKLMQRRGLSADEIDAYRAEEEELRRRIPPFVIEHFDRLEESGKPGIADIGENGTCSACGAKIPESEIEYIKKNRNIGVCDSCFAFLYIAH